MRAAKMESPAEVAVIESITEAVAGDAIGPSLETTGTAIETGPTVGVTLFRIQFAGRPKVTTGTEALSGPLLNKVAVTFTVSPIDALSGEPENKRPTSAEPCDGEPVMELLTKTS